jgi:hypothetical protein
MSLNLFLTGRQLAHQLLFIIERSEMSIFNQKPKEESIEARQTKHPTKGKEGPEQQWAEERATEKVAEFETLQEQVNINAPAQQANDTKQGTSQTLKDLKIDEKLEMAKPGPEPLVETDQVPTKDKGWVEKVEEVIKKDKDKPYQEEEDAEVLQQEYLKKSFKEDVRIDE